MYKLLLITATLIVLCAFAKAQTMPVHHDFTITKGATINVSALPADWHVHLYNTVEEDLGPEPDKAEMQRIKQVISERYPAGLGQRTMQRTQVVNAPSL